MSRTTIEITKYASSISFVITPPGPLLYAGQPTGYGIVGQIARRANAGRADGAI
jgi:hypothetical protein